MATKLGKWLRAAIAFVAVLALMVLGTLWIALPTMDGVLQMAGLSYSTDVQFDQAGIPRIEASSREDAYCTLGFVTARDRLFQMDLIRRQMAGELAEVFGPEMLESDRWHRTMGFAQVASQVLATLPEEQRTVVESYTKGINNAIASRRILPFEFLALRYTPKPWRPEDSILAVLSMYPTLAWHGEFERMSTIMRAALPQRVVDFFLPMTDPYTDAIFTGRSPRHPSVDLPTTELIQLLHNQPKSADLANIISPHVVKSGSNAWVIAGPKSAAKHAMLANDMHLSLTVPGIWYRAELHYDDVHIAGLTLPGAPLIVSGSNKQIAWGFTASGADVSDLIRLEVDAQKPAEYSTAEGNLHFGERTETLHIRGKPDETMKIRTTKWGPVMSDTLLGKPVAVHWTALDASSTDLKLLDLDRSSSVEAALPIINKAGGPPLNTFIADADGNIGWTMNGRIPLRTGPSGLYAASSLVAAPTWQELIPPASLPREINPVSGFIVSGNQHMLQWDPYAIGLYDWRGYRAFQIAEQLRGRNNLTEGDSLNLQLDARALQYRYYQKLALEVLETNDPTHAQDIAEIRRYLRAWNGQADPDSLGIALLAEFRQTLLESVVSPYFESCKKLDPNFNYFWGYLDVPLQSLLEANRTDILPNSKDYADRNAFVLEILLQSAGKLKKEYRVDRLDDLTWGSVNPVRIAHPLSAALPSWLASVLNMPAQPIPGCEECPRSFVSDGGASDRLVVAPGHDNDGILEVPGGQSGNPISPYYRDQYTAWAQGKPTPLWTGVARHILRIDPIIGEPAATP